MGKGVAPVSAQAQAGVVLVKKSMKKSLSAAATTSVVGTFDESFDLMGRAEMGSRSAALLPPSSLNGAARIGSPASSVGGGRTLSSSSGTRVVSDHAAMMEKLDRIKKAYKAAHRRRGPSNN